MGIHRDRGDHRSLHVEDLRGDDRSRSLVRRDDRMGCKAILEDADLPVVVAAEDVTPPTVLAVEEGNGHRRILDHLVVPAVGVANSHNPAVPRREGLRRSALVELRSCKR